MRKTQTKAPTLREQDRRDPLRQRRRLTTMDLIKLTEELSISEQKLIADTREFWADTKADKSFAQWMALGDALLIGRRLCMRALHITEPKGRGYAEMFSQWCDLNYPGLSGPTEKKSQLRSILIYMAEQPNRAQVDKMREVMDTGTRIKVGPDGMYKRLRRMQKLYDEHDKTDAGDEETEKVSPMQRLKNEMADLSRKYEEAKAASDGNLFDLKKTDIGQIARITLEQCGLPRTKALVVALELVIKEAELLKKRKMARMAG